MNSTSLQKIEKAARFLRTPTAQTARGYLDQPLETALKVLDCFADGKPRHPDQVAEELGLSETTVKQVLSALNRGGYGLIFSPSQGWTPSRVGGRPPIEVQLKSR